MLRFDRHISLLDDELVVDSLSPHINPPRIPTTTEPCLPAEMQSESARLQSFATWPVNGARKLARYGFYASSENDYITCAFCGLEISGFSSWREVKTWHWEVSGKDCPLLKEQGEETVPKFVYTSSKESVDSINTNYRTEYLQLLKSSLPQHREHCRGMPAPASPDCARLMRDSGEISQQVGGWFAASEFRVDEPAREKLGSHQDLARSVISSFTTFTSSPPKSASSSSTRRNATQSNVNVSSSTRSASTSSTTLISIPSPSIPTPSTPSSSSSSTPSSQRAAAAAAGPGGVMPWRELVRTAQVPHMVAYQARLESLSSWPLLSPTPRDLARAGLFRDTKSSPSSSSSSSSSPPLSSRACPSSASLSSLSPPQPSKSSPSPSSSSSSPPPPSATRSDLTESSSPARIFQSCSNPKEKEEDSSQQPASPKASGGGSRASGWQQDSVQCFWCGVHMHRWQQSDDPVLEHARLSPDCRYVMQLLGHQLHRDVIATAAGAGSVGNCSRKDR